MKKPQNIHDTNFKYNFTKREVALDFLKHNLPPKILKKIDIDSVRVEPNELLPSRFRNSRHADVIYSVKSNTADKVYILVHLEAQRGHDLTMPARILEYQSAVIMRLFKHGLRKIPAIISYVFYTGKEEWTSARSIAEACENYDEYRELAIEHNYIVDMGRLKLDSLVEQEKAKLPQVIMKGSVGRDFSPFVPEICEDIKDVGSSQQYDEVNMGYILSIDPHVKDLMYEFSKFGVEITDNQKDMFDAAIKRESTRSLKIGKQLGRLEGIKIGLNVSAVW